ncbi:hypothetical protein Sm713_20460 [Streptomyces sp. TS71-3]|nr:hypothetical protein Sm713_20460 [Streptomyces sp. TS71-3]
MPKTTPPTPRTPLPYRYALHCPTSPLTPTAPKTARDCVTAVLASRRLAALADDAALSVPRS